MNDKQIENLVNKNKKKVREILSRKCQTCGYGKENRTVNNVRWWTCELMRGQERSSRCKKWKSPEEVRQINMEKIMDKSW